MKTYYYLTLLFLLTIGITSAQQNMNSATSNHALNHQHEANWETQFEAMFDTLSLQKFQEDLGIYNNSSQSFEISSIVDEAYEGFVKEIKAQLKLDFLNFDANAFKIKYAQLLLSTSKKLKGKGKTPTADPPKIINGPCVNMDLEACNFSGWTLTRGTANGSVAYSFVSPVAVASPGGGTSHVIYSGGTDPVCGIPRENPFSGGCSAMLGNGTGTGKGAARMEQTFMVDATNYMFSYAYAVVFENPTGHALNEMPYFSVRMFNSAGTSIACGEYNVIAGSGATGFSTTNYGGEIVQYRNWTNVVTNLSSFIGQNVTIQFTSGDCSQSGHYGYAYVDASCNAGFITATQSTICQGNSTTLTAPSGVQSYLWNTGPTTQSITVSPATTTTYTCTITPLQGAGCNFNLPYTINVNPTPVASFTGSASACINTPVNFASTSTIAAPGVITRWRWNFGDGVITPLSSGAISAVANTSGTYTNPVHTYATAGTYNVTLYVETADGCFHQVTVPITINALPVVVAGTPQTVCQGANVTLSGSGASTYTWNNGVTNGVAFAPPLGTTTYTVTGTSAAGCINTANVNVTVNPSPTVNAGPDRTVCQGVSFTPSGSGANTYTWNNGAVNNVAMTQAVGSITYTVTGTSAAGCTNTDQMVVTVVTPTTLTLTPSTQYLCFGVPSIPLTPTVTGGATPYTYSWSSGQTTPSINASTGGNYTVTLTDASGCPALNATVNVIQFTAPITANAGPDQSLCGSIATNIPINGSVTGVTTGVWSGGTGTYTSNTSDLTLNYTFSAAELAAGTITLTLTPTNNGTCPATPDQVVISLSELVVSMNSLQNATCFGGTGTAIINVAGNVGATTYSLDGGATQASNTFNFIPAGAHTVTVVDSRGCSGTVNFTVTQPTQVSFTQVMTSPLCNGDCNGQAVITASGGTAPYQYSSNNGATFGASNTLTGLCAGTIGLVVRDANGCLANASVNLTQPTPLSATYVLNNPVCFEVCNGSIVVTASGGVTPYQYNVDNGPYQASNTLAGLCDGYHVPMVRDANGCLTTTTYQLLSNPPEINISQVSMTPSNCLFPNGAIEVGATGTNPPFQYSMNGGTNQPTGVYTNLVANAYQFVVTDNLGCTDTAYYGVNDVEMSGIILDQTNVLCYGGFDGTVSVTNLAGSGPFTFVLDQSLSQSLGSFSGLPAGSHIVTIYDAGNCVFNLPFTVTQPDELQFLPITTNVACNGGSDGTITFSAQTGGTGAYEYSLDASTWQASPTFNTLPAGFYFLYMADANVPGQTCNSMNFAIIDEAPALNMTSAVTDLTCNGNSSGTITLDATGGTAPYQYSVDGGVTYASTSLFFSLPAGTYNCFVRDAANCTFNISVTVNQPAVLTAANVDIPTLCFGSCDGQINVTANGGTAPYMYSLDGGVINNSNTNLPGLCAGAYTVTTTDVNGCTTTSNSNITSPTQLVLNASEVPSTCSNPNGEINVGASGATPSYTFSIDNVTFAAGTNFPNLLAGSYTIYAKDAQNCTANITQIVTNLASPVISNYTSQNVTCNAACNGQIVITGTGGTGALQYSIGGAYQASGTFTGLCAGAYNLSVQDANGCITNGTSPVIITEPSVLTSSFTQVNLTCFQNNTGSLDISAAGGTLPHQFSIDNGVTFISDSLFNTLAAGTYNIVVQDANNCSVTNTATITEPALLDIANLVTTNAVCYNVCDGSAIATVVGGTGAYQYDWTPFNPDGNVNFFNSLCDGNYSLKVIDANGCKDSVQFTITEPTQLLVTAAVSTDALCNASCDGTITVTSPTATQFSIDNGVTFQASNVFNGVCAGAYNIVTQDVTNCISAPYAVVNVNEPPVLYLNVNPDTVICPGSSGTLTTQAFGGTAPYNYNWDNGITTTTQVVTPAVNTTYVVIATDAHGCVSVPAPTQMILYTPLTVTPSTHAPICPGDPVSPFVHIDTDEGTSVYQWTYNGTVIGTDSVINVNPTVTSQYIYSITDFCSNIIDTIDITVYTVPTITPSASAAEGCTPMTVTITPDNAASIGSNCTWTFSDGTVVNGCGAISPTFTPPGCYSVDFTATSVDGCPMTGSATNLFCVLPNPIVTAGADSTLCIGTTGTLHASASSGTAPYTYNWSNGVSGSSQVITPAVNTTYTVSVTDTKGCISVATDDTQFSLYAPLTTNPVDPAAVCPGTAVTLDATPTNGQPAYTYAWTYNGTNVGSASTLNINPTVSGQYIVTVNDFCTTEIDTFDITVFTVPTITPSASAAEGCTPMTVTITPDNAASIGSNCTWTFSDGTVVNGCGPISPTFTPPGCYSVDFTATSVDGCPMTGSATNLFCVLPNPIVTAGADSTLCIGTTGTLHASASSGTAPYTYNWSNGVSGSSQVITPAVNTTYTVSVTDAKGCISVASDNTQFSLYPALTTNFVTPAAVCPGTNVPLSVNVVTGQPTYTYAWSLNGTNIGSTSSINVTPNVSGVYTVTTTDLCTSVTDNVNVTVFTVPQVSFVPNVANGCSPLTITMTPNVPSAQLGSNCTWTFSDGTVTNDCGPTTATFTEVGCYDVTFTSTSLDGCPIVANGTNEFCISPDPIAGFAFGNTNPTYLNPNVPIYDQSVDADSYFYDFGFFGLSNEQNPIINTELANVGDTITVCQTVVSVYGCRDTICKEIVYKEEFSIYVPNTFTPDENSVNQVFGPVFPAGISIDEYTLLIFNRWGEVVFESHDPAVGWNGKYANFTAQDGVYTWKIMVKEGIGTKKTHNFVGHVNLLR